MKRESLLVESTPALAGKSTTNAHGGGNLDFAGRPWPDSPTVDSRTRIAVFVASPGDTQEERRCLQRVVAELNRGVAEDRQLLLDLVCWETHAWPGAGADAQDVINQQIPPPDIFIGIFWKRLGTPTQRASSGTVEEVERALAKWREGGRIPILIYFNQSPYLPTKEDLAQHRGVLEFRDHLTKQGLLVADYLGVADFESKARQHLTQVVRTWTAGAVVPPPAAPVKEGPSATGVSPPDLQGWHQSLSGGSLAVGLDARSSAAVYNLVAVVGAVLGEKAFVTRTVDRLAIILMELLNNVARHVPESTARVELELQTKYLRSVGVTVLDSGRGFELQNVLRTHFRLLAEGEREHGLMRVLRFSDDLRSLEGPSPAHPHGIACQVYDVGQPRSALWQYGGLTPVRLEYEFPKVLWLGMEAHVGWEFLSALATTVEEGWSAAFLELYFKPPPAGAPRHLAVEVTGHKFQTEVPPGSLATLRAALEIYFRAYLDEKRVIFFVHDTDFSLQHSVRNWARAWGCPCFEAEGDLVRHLQELEAGPGSPG